MLIQNANSMVQAQQPARLAGDGGPVAVVTPSNVQAPPELPQTTVEQPAEQQPVAAQLQSAVDNINTVLKQSNKYLQFTFDSESKNPVVKLVDSETGDVIRQHPSEEALAIAKAIDVFQQVHLIKQEA